MKFPTLTPTGTSRQITDTFAGYNHNLKISDGEFYDTKNLTTQYYPMLASRKSRGLMSTALTQAQGLIAKDALAYVDNGTLYYNSLATPVTGLASGLKQLVSMGAYIIIFPDKVYYNTADGADYGSLDADWTYTGSATYEMCDSDGAVYAAAESGATEPVSPANRDLWIDTAENALKEYSTSLSMWVSIETVYTKITFTTQGQIPGAFKEYDGVEISGAYFDDLNGSKILYGLGGSAGTASDYIIVIGILGNAYSQTGASIRIKRSAPAMDYVCECQNRLWGCFYGNDGAKNLNELYCCALGDFKNWSQYLGLSTDSWRGSVGSDGVWTGCINYLGSPTFFKEDRIHIVSVSSEGAHRVSDTPCRGVQSGSSRSLVVVNETLYYKSRTDVCAYQGGFPETVSKALGDERYYSAAAGAFGQRYYLCMADSADAWHMFVFDIKNGLWMHEDNLHASAFARVDDELYCLVGNSIYALNGTAGTAESAFEWSAETGILCYEYPDKKYVSRYNIRLRMAAGATARLYIEYDSDGVWIDSGTVALSGTGTVTLPVKPLRCDHMRFKLTGTGEVKIFSIARILEQGSDM